MSIGCESAKYDVDEGRYICSVSGGNCMYMTPNSKKCAEQFGEGPDAFADENCKMCQYYKVIDGHHCCCAKWAKNTLMSIYFYDDECDNKCNDIKATKVVGYEDTDIRMICKDDKNITSFSCGGFKKLETYNKDIMEAMVEIMNKEESDIPYISKQEINSNYSLTEIFDTYLNYEGFCGYTEKLIDVIKEIFGVDLHQISDEKSFEDTNLDEYRASLKDYQSI